MTPYRLRFDSYKVKNQGTSEGHHLHFIFFDLVFGCFL